MDKTEPKAAVASKENVVVCSIKMNHELYAMLMIPVQAREAFSLSEVVRRIIGEAQTANTALFQRLGEIRKAKV